MSVASLQLSTACLVMGVPPPPPHTPWPSPRFPDPRPHFLLARGVSRVQLAVTRFSSSRPRVYYTILDILCECFFGEDKRREKKGPQKKKKKKSKALLHGIPPTKELLFFCIICKKQKEREREVGSLGSVSKLRWGLPRFKPHLSVNLGEPHLSSVARPP